MNEYLLTKDIYIAHSFIKQLFLELLSEYSSFKKKWAIPEFLLKDYAGTEQKQSDYLITKMRL